MHTTCMRAQAAIPGDALADAARFTHPGLQQVSSSACCAGGCLGVLIRGALQGTICSGLAFDPTAAAYDLPLTCLGVGSAGGS